MSRDAKQEALDFLEALEGDRVMETTTGSSKPSSNSSFKAFNPSHQVPSFKPTQNPNPSAYKGLPTAANAPPVVSGGGSTTSSSISSKPVSKHVFYQGAVAVPSAPSPASPKQRNASPSPANLPPSTELQSLSLQPIQQPPPPPLIKPANNGHAQSAPSSKRVHAFVPGMKPTTSTPPPSQVPGFNPTNTATFATVPSAPSFPIGEPIDRSTVQQADSFQIQNQEHQQIEQDQDSAWSWGTSLWTTAQKGLESAKTIAGSAAQTIQQSETVKELVKNYKPELEKLGNAIAPPLSFIGGDGVKFPQGLTVWLCLSLPPSLVGERVLRMAKQAMREWWNGNLILDHPGATVNFVDDTSSSSCSTVHQAVFKAEETMEKLQKLANGQVGETKHVLFVIQPFNTTIQSTILESADHAQFYCSMVCDAPTNSTANAAAKSALIHASCISQSVSLDDADWRSEMFSRVLETAVSDLVEEFGTKLK